MTVEYTVDYHEPNNDLEKHSGGLDTETVLALEAALITVFQTTQAQVHVHSGRLRESGRIESHTHGNTWTGEIKYGGGISRVDYAWFEQRRGGTHNFMLVAQHMDGTIGIAFRTGLD